MQVLTDARWSRFEAARLRGARPRKDDRSTIEAIICRLGNGADGAQSRLNSKAGTTPASAFSRWAVAGVRDWIMGHIDGTIACTLGSSRSAPEQTDDGSLRFNRSTSDNTHAPGRSRTGIDSKIVGSATLPGGWAILSWCRVRRTKLRPRSCG